MKMNPLVGAILESIPVGPIDGFPEVISSGHRRSVAIKSNNKYFSIKGVGWVHGPPWSFPSPKDNCLYFGLMDLKSAERELKVSSWFEGAGIHSTRVRLLRRLDDYELSLIGLNTDVRFKDGSKIDPVILITESLTAKRINDFNPRVYSDWLNEFELLNKSHENGSRDLLSCFIECASKLAKSISAYQLLGACNDSLSPDNVTIAGEITDYEWVYVPGIPLPDGTTDVMLFERQLKEAIYYIDVLLVLAEGLNIKLSILEISNIGYNLVREFNTGFSLGLRKIIESS